MLAFRKDDKAFFIYDFAKNQRANISPKELKALKILAKELLSYGDKRLKKALDVGQLIEVKQ